MRDIPGVVWILGGFLPLALALFIYAKLGPTTMPPVQSSWQQVEWARQQLQSRMLNLKVGQSHDVVIKPFALHLQRRPDIKEPTIMGHYVLSVKPVKKIAELDYWLQAGLEVGLLDSEPNASLGEVHLVAVKVVKDNKL